MNDKISLFFKVGELYFGNPIFGFKDKIYYCDQKIRNCIPILKVLIDLSEKDHVWKVMQHMKNK